MIDDILRGTLLRTPAYTPEQRAEDVRKLRQRIEHIAARRNNAARGTKGGWLMPTSPQLAELLLEPVGDTVSISTWQLRRQLHYDLKSMCRLVIRAPGSADRLLAFVDGQLRMDPVAARSFACLLFTNGHADGARFWWRFAAGADDATSAYCLFLEGLLRGNPSEAISCYRNLDGAAFLCDADWEDAYRADGRPVNDALKAEVDDQIREVNAGTGIHVPIPQEYFEEVPEEYRDSLLCQG
ncbi:hypothetical protein [Streptomyces sp. 8N706]|uniref:hypothetical protein n=1 Tax=Streptomyces sp. 8N706 TaxID=3457416 RepID=UPI003FD5CE0E